MQYSIYAFIPFGVLLAIAFVAAPISLWPRARRRQIGTISNQPRRSAEILYFPSRRAPAPAARHYRKG
jgi:hypothetical protein